MQRPSAQIAWIPVVLAALQCEEVVSRMLANGTHRRAPPEVKP